MHIWVHHPGKMKEFSLKLFDEAGRKVDAVRPDQRRAPGQRVKCTIDEELWDVICCMIAIANYYGIDPAQAIVEMETISSVKYKTGLTPERGK